MGILIYIPLQIRKEREFSRRIRPHWNVVTLTTIQRRPNLRRVQCQKCSAKFKQVSSSRRDAALHSFLAHSRQCHTIKVADSSFIFNNQRKIINIKYPSFDPFEFIAFMFEPSTRLLWKSNVNGSCWEIQAMARMFVRDFNNRREEKKLLSRVGGMHGVETFLGRLFDTNPNGLDDLSYFPGRLVLVFSAASQTVPCRLEQWCQYYNDVFVFLSLRMGLQAQICPHSEESVSYSQASKSMSVNVSALLPSVSSGTVQRVGIERLHFVLRADHRHRPSRLGRIRACRYQISGGLRCRRTSFCRLNGA